MLKFALIVILSLIVGSRCYTRVPNEFAAIYEEASHSNPADGTYNYEFRTTNGINVKEAGVAGLYASGTFEYYSPDADLIELKYTADENGFHPRGAHLPTPPPVPEHIVRALAYIKSRSMEVSK